MVVHLKLLLLLYKTKNRGIAEDLDSDNKMFDAVMYSVNI